MPLSSSKSIISDEFLNVALDNTNRSNVQNDYLRDWLRHMLLMHDLEKLCMSWRLKIL